MSEIATFGPNGGALAPYGGGASHGIPGLEDFSEGGIHVPYLRVVHDEATFVLDGTDLAWPGHIELIALGIIKGRTKWSDDKRRVGVDGVQAQCRSFDGVNGQPNVSPDAHPKDAFPWAESPWTPENAPLGPGGMLGSVQSLSCGRCQFAEWTGEKDDRTPPACSEQHTWAVLVWDGSNFTPALLKIQKTGIPASRKHINWFIQRRKSPWTHITVIDLEPQMHGTTKFCIPKFSTGAATDPSGHDEYHGQYNALRTLAHSVYQPDGTFWTPPTVGSPAPAPEPQVVVTAEVVTAEVVTEPPATDEPPVPPAPARAPRAKKPPAPPVAAPPVAAPPAPPAPPVAAPPAPPVAAPPVAAPPAPPAPPVAAPPAPPVAAPPDQGGWPEGEDDLPF